MFCLLPLHRKRISNGGTGVEGSFRFLNRVWRLVDDHLEKIKDAPVYDGKAHLDGDLKDSIGKPTPPSRRSPAISRIGFILIPPSVPSWSLSTHLQGLGSRSWRRGVERVSGKEAVESTILLLFRWFTLLRTGDAGKSFAQHAAEV
jgi:hypothetical protein